MKKNKIELLINKQKFSFVEEKQVASGYYEIFIYLLYSSNTDLHKFAVKVFNFEGLSTVTRNKLMQ